MEGKYKISGMHMNGYEIKGAMLNGNEVYDTNPNPYYVVYTIDKSSPTDLLNNGKYLPVDYETFAYKILINGKEVTDLNIEVGNINKIKIYYDATLNRMSFRSTNIKTIEYIYTYNFTSMDTMFCDCHLLTSLDVSNWDTSKVTDMKFLFCGCRTLTSLDLSNWDTGKVLTYTLMLGYLSADVIIDDDKWNPNMTEDAVDYVGTFTII